MSRGENNINSSISEIFTIKCICQKLNISFLYDKNLREFLAKAKTDELSSPSCILIKKYDTASLIEGYCQKIYFGKAVLRVEWRGNNRNNKKGKEKTKGDIFIIFTDGSILKFSLKVITSSKNGQGTTGNLGSCFIKKHFGIDKNKEMAKAVKEKLTTCAGTSFKNKTAVKKFCNYEERQNDNRYYTEIAAKEALPYIHEVLDKMCQEMTTFDINKINALIEEMTGSDEKELATIVVNNGGAKIYDGPCKSKDDLKFSKNDIFSIEKKDVGVVICKNNKQILRINLCCPNGVGLCAMCLRVSLI